MSTMKMTVKETLSTDTQSLPGEIWEYIPQTNERYLISNYSRVMSVIKSKPIIVKKSLSNGRFKVIIYPKKGQIKNIECRRLVAQVFLREPNDNEVIKPKDGNILNDSLNNLEWISKKESARIAVEKGRFPAEHGRGRRNGMSLLSASIAEEIRNKKVEGKTYNQLAQDYKVSITCIQDIMHNRTWKNIS